MAEPWLDRLVELVPVPAGFGGCEYDWAPTEEALGREIPGTFKDLVRAYGGVAFEYGYLSPFFPSPGSGFDLLEGTWEYREILEIYAFPRPPEVLPAGVRIEPAELIKWGGAPATTTCGTPGRRTRSNGASS